MQVIVEGRNTHLTPRLHETAQRKLDRFERLARDAMRAEVQFGEAKNPRVPGHHDCTVTLHLRHGSVTAHAHGDTPVAALDAVLAKVRRQLERLKGLRVNGAGARRAGRRARTRS